MTFSESIKTCFSKYATFDGTAPRSEYWWFFLFLCLGSFFCGLFSQNLQLAFNIATLLPSLAAGARRLHDTDRSGWWQLLMFVPLIGWIVLIVFWVQESRPNRYADSMQRYA
ncbi:DUF805 domain-containing protein [Massilia norwichensis]|jgi:uncharacterized membrane protein YhaH (DUF805 family)|uniref:DUF805 domain-containing protein n=1 Tax=Massilia norwichensis TaxID=1442366 RepID=A0ABT2A6R7_9BURK|nr:DUF805 domain-containing protein [Massilia norwichensis]MCS0589895.1 DUF805 domain-containing protein [Massilia norwichensis]